MPMHAAATAMVQIIGIFLMTRNLPGDGHYRAIAPRIGSQQHSVYSIPTIEPHSAFIAFSKGDLLQRINWDPTPFNPPQADLLFVRLDGEQITLEPSGPKTKRGQQSSDLKLPHLQSWCPAATALRPEYRGPDFRGAAAVVDFSPFAKLVTCGAEAAGVSSTRLDTQVMIDNEGEVTIVGKKNGKTKMLRLRGTAHVYFLSLPSSFLGSSATPQTYSAPHYRAYFAMIDAPAGCTWGPVVKAGSPVAKARPGASTTAATDIPPCNPEALRYARTGSVPVTDSAMINMTGRIDAECANSQWP